jgi:DNA-binding beta-propeller fold protein YncE
VIALTSIVAGCAAHHVDPLPTSPPPHASRRSVTYSLPVPARPYGLAIAGRNAYVTQLDAASYTRIATDGDRSITGTFTTGRVPTGIAATPDGATVVVASQDGRVTLHDGDTGRILNTFRMHDSPFRAIVSRDGLSAYALSSEGDLLIIDLVRRVPRATIPTGLQLTNGLVESRDGRTVYVSSTAGNIAAVSVRGNDSVRKFEVPGVLQDIALSPDGGELYVADESGAVEGVRLADGYIRRLEIGPSFGLAVSPDGSRLWVTQPTSGHVVVVDRTEFVRLRTIAIWPGRTNAPTPRRIAFDASGDALVSDESGFVHRLR